MSSERLKIDTSAWIVSELRARLRETVACRIGLRIERQRFGEVVQGGLRIRVLQRERADVYIRRRIARVCANRRFERRPRAVLTSQCRARRAEQVLRAGVIG